MEINCRLSHEALVFGFLEAAKQRWDLQRRSPAVCFLRRVPRAGRGGGGLQRKGLSEIDEAGRASWSILEMRHTPGCREAAVGLSLPGWLGSANGSLDLKRPSRGCAVNGAQGDLCAGGSPRPSVKADGVVVNSEDACMNTSRAVRCSPPICPGNVFWGFPIRRHNPKGEEEAGRLGLGQLPRRNLET